MGDQDEQDETWIVIKAMCLNCNYKWLHKVPLSFDRDDTVPCEKCGCLTGVLGE